MEKIKVKTSFNRLLTEEKTKSFDVVVKSLQDEAKRFLLNDTIVLNGICIRPKEIEVYYYKKNKFDDNSVHKNELQRNNKNHFYIHRWGTEKTDSYKGGNYPGIDFVISDDENTYYSYLIRSAIVKNELIVGPHKVLESIIKECKMTYEDIEKTSVEIVQNKIFCDVLFSSRINLGKTVFKEYSECNLRAVACDEYFRGNKYPQKEKMIIDFISEKQMTKVQAVEYAKEKLGYLPSKIREL
ncbi:MAG: hypothetical protein IKO90_06210 [Bacteroidales bacterium]|nr:hypothetical protein [Bacteroidales bacterium]